MMKLLVTLSTCLVTIGPLLNAETCDKGAGCKNCVVPSKVSLLTGAEKSAVVYYAVTGMKGEECGSKVTSALTKIDGVSVEKICHTSGCVVVKFDAAQTGKAAILRAIIESGFAVAGEKVSVQVVGLKCAGCCADLEEKVEEVDGCSEAHACHKSQSISVIIDTSKTSQKEVEEKILASGFKLPKAECDSACKTECDQG